jgi:ADP-ribosylglycohydrolase
MDAPSISCAATRAGRAALHRFERTGEPWCGSTDPETTGNGSIMRLAPVPLFFAQDPVRAVAEAADSSRTTHGAPGAVDACRYLAALIVGAVEGRSKEELLLLLLHFAPDPGLWGAQSLAPPIAGDDADTTGAVYGQLAGAFYGVEAIPTRWRQKLVARDTLERLADGLLRAAGDEPSTERQMVDHAKNARALGHFPRGPSLARRCAPAAARAVALQGASQQWHVRLAA